MKIENVELVLDRVEVKKTVFNKANQIIEESWEFWYPKEVPKKSLGYKTSK